MFTLYWTREDGQGSYEMGCYATEAEADAAIPAATAEIIANACPYPQTDDNPDFVRCRDEILSGSWSTDEVEDEASRVRFG